MIMNKRVWSSFGMLMLAVVLLGGCKMLGKAGSQPFNDVSSSELKAIRDSFYVLDLVPTPQNPNLYQFVTCHLGENNQPVMGGCVSAFVDEAGGAVTISREVLDSIRNSGGNADEDNELAAELNSALRGTSIVGHLSGASAAAGVVAGAVVLGKGIAFMGAVASKIMVTVTVIGVAGGGVYYFLNSDHSKFLNFHRERIKADLVNLGKNTVDLSADTVGKVANEVAVDVAQGLIDAHNGKDGDAGNHKSEVKIVLWGSAARSVASEWEHIIDNDTAFTAHPVSAKIPDMLPVIAGVLEASGLVNQGAIAYHCLPRHKSTRTTSVPACMTMKQQWSAGGLFKYMKPTSLGGAS